MRPRVGILELSPGISVRRGFSIDTADEQVSASRRLAFLSIVERGTQPFFVGVNESQLLRSHAGHLLSSANLGAISLRTEHNITTSPRRAGLQRADNPIVLDRFIGGMTNVERGAERNGSSLLPMRYLAPPMCL